MFLTFRKSWCVKVRYSVRFKLSGVVVFVMLGSASMETVLYILNYDVHYLFTKLLVDCAKRRSLIQRDILNRFVLCLRVFICFRVDFYYYLFYFFIFFYPVSATFMSWNCMTFAWFKNSKLPNVDIFKNGLLFTTLLLCWERELPQGLCVNDRVKGPRDELKHCVYLSWETLEITTHHCIVPCNTLTLPSRVIHSVEENYGNGLKSIELYEKQGQDGYVTIFSGTCLRKLVSRSQRVLCARS